MIERRSLPGAILAAPAVPAFGRTARAADEITIRGRAALGPPR